MAKNRNVSSSEQQRMNLAALKRVDPYIERLLASAKHVALYKFGQSDGQWEKTETEGTFFVYERQGDPQYGFIVLNRLSQKNLIEPITKEMDFQLKPPFLLYKTQESEIFGIWFHEGEECERLARTMLGLVAKTEERMKKRQTEAKNKPNDLAGLLAKAGVAPTKQKPQPSQQQNQGGNKLMSLLTSASTAASTSHEHVKPEQDSPPIMTNAINGSGNVAAFFAQAASSGPPLPAAIRTDGNPMPHHPIPVMGHPPQQMMFPVVPPPMAMNFAAAASAGSSDPRLPMQLVQQPPPGLELPVQRATVMSNSPKVENNPAMARLLSNPGVHSLENLERIQRLESVSPSGTSPSAPHPTPTGMAMPPLPIMAQSAGELEAMMATKMDLNNKPHLLSPMVFAKPSPNKLVADNFHPEQTSIVNGLNNGGDADDLQITPLTQSQLIQAFQHLLRTDKSFVSKLHLAYVESLNTKLQ